MPPQIDTLYQRTYRLQANILLLQNWQNELRAKASQLPPTRQKWLRSLAVQELLSEHKSRYLQFAASEIKKNQPAIAVQIHVMIQHNPSLATL